MAQLNKHFTLTTALSQQGYFHVFHRIPQISFQFVCEDSIERNILFLGHNNKSP